LLTAQLVAALGSIAATVAAGASATLLVTGAAAIAMSSDAHSQTRGFSAASTNAEKMQGRALDVQPGLSGGIFAAQLNRGVPLIGWLELFGGCPDGDTGAWSFDSIPSYGHLSSALVNTGKKNGCLNDWIYNALYYTMNTPIPYGFSDRIQAHWQSGHVGPQHGDWTAAYTALSVTRPYFDLPCGGCLPFGGTGYPPSNWLKRVTIPAVAAGARAAENNTLELWRIAGNQVVDKQIIAHRNSEWQVLGQRDFDGDRKADILWGNDRKLEIWFMDGFNVKSMAEIDRAPADSTLVGTGALISTVEVNGAITGSLIWRGNTTGAVSAWLMNGGQVTAKVKLGTMPIDWSIVGNDNKGDIVWRNTAGDVLLWQVSGAGPDSVRVKKNIALDNMPTSSEVASLGDFDGNGYIDVLWRDPTTGAVSIWFLDKKGLDSKADLPVRPTNWKIAQTGDYRGAGTSDILWVNQRGDLQIWFMNGRKIASKAEMGNIGKDGVIESRNSE
jgi:hypothetical protein